MAKTVETKFHMYPFKGKGKVISLKKKLSLTLMDKEDFGTAEQKAIG